MRAERDAVRREPAVCSTAIGIVVVDFDGSNRAVITPPSVVGEAMEAASLSPDGTHVVFLADADPAGESHVHGMRLDGSEFTRLSEDRCRCFQVVTGGRASLSG